MGARWTFHRRHVVVAAAVVVLAVARSPRVGPVSQRHGLLRSASSGWRGRRRPGRRRTARARGVEPVPGRPGGRPAGRGAAGPRERPRRARPCPRPHLATRIEGRLRPLGGAGWPVGRLPTALDLVAAIHPPAAAGGHPASGPGPVHQGGPNTEGPHSAGGGVHSTDRPPYRPGSNPSTHVRRGRSGGRPEPAAELAETRLKLQARPAAAVRPWPLFGANRPWREAVAKTRQRVRTAGTSPREVRTAVGVTGPGRRPRTLVARQVRGCPRPEVRAGAPYGRGT